MLYHSVLCLVFLFFVRPFLSGKVRALGIGKRTLPIAYTVYTVPQPPQCLFSYHHTDLIIADTHRKAVLCWLDWLRYSSDLFASTLSHTHTHTHSLTSSESTTRNPTLPSYSCATPPLSRSLAPVSRQRAAPTSCSCVRTQSALTTHLQEIEDEIEDESNHAEKMKSKLRDLLKFCGEYEPATEVDGGGSAASTPDVSDGSAVFNSASGVTLGSSSGGAGSSGKSADATATPSSSHSTTAATAPASTASTAASSSATAASSAAAAAAKPQDPRSEYVYIYWDIENISIPGILNPKKGGPQVTYV